MSGKQWSIFVGVGIAIISIWSKFGGYEALSTPDGKKIEAIAALFSGFAFLGMIITLIMQKEELELQRKELEQTREELARTAKANEDAARIAEQNLKTQKIIADEKNLHTRNNIKALSIIERIRNLNEAMQSIESSAFYDQKVFDRYTSERENLFKALETLSSPPSTPEA